MASTQIAKYADLSIAAAIIPASLYFMLQDPFYLFTFTIGDYFTHQAHAYSLLVFSLMLCYLAFVKKMYKEAPFMTLTAVALFDSIGGLAGGWDYVLIGSAVVMWDVMIFGSYILVLRNMKMKLKFFVGAVLIFLAASYLEAPYQAGTNAAGGYILEAIMETLMCVIVITTWSRRPNAR